MESWRVALVICKVNNKGQLDFGSFAYFGGKTKNGLKYSHLYFKFDFVESIIN